LTSLTPSGTNWSFQTIDSTVTATYTGTYPVVASQDLPVITITGTLTANGLGLLTNSATVSTPNDSDLSNNTAQDTITLYKKPNLWIFKYNDGGDTFEVGQQVTYHISVQDVANAGPVLAPGPITVTEDIPSGLIVTSVIENSWSFTQTSSTITLKYIGAYPIVPNQTLPIIDVVGILTSDGLGQLTNTATVSTPNDSNLSNNTTQDPINVTSLPGLSIVNKTKEGKSYYAGQRIHYQLKVNTNSLDGPVLASDPVVVVDSLPAGLTDVKPSGSHWSFLIVNWNVIATYVGSYPIAAGSQLPPITIGATLVDPQSLHQISSTASVGTQMHPEVGNSSTEVVLVRPSPDLKITNTNSGGSSFLVGQTIHYHLRVHNLSTAAAVPASGPITVIDYLPAGLGSVSASGDDWHIEVTPTRVIATYTGAYPVRSGATLPTITVTGIFTRVAVPFVVTKASIKTPLDFNDGNDWGECKVHVRVG
jgi:uncharacterized repeat protein (TIGR01451 family)